MELHLRLSNPNAWLHFQRLHAFWFDARAHESFAFSMVFMVRSMKWTVLTKPQIGIKVSHINDSRLTINVNDVATYIWRVCQNLTWIKYILHQVQVAKLLCCCDYQFKRLIFSFQKVENDFPIWFWKRAWRHLVVPQVLMMTLRLDTKSDDSESKKACMSSFSMTDNICALTDFTRLSHSERGILRKSPSWFSSVSGANSI